MQKTIRNLIVKENIHLTPNHSLLKLTSQEPLPTITPGQFAQIKTNANVLLRRPISIHNIIETNNEIWFLIHAVGKGTQALYNTLAGNLINVLFPLGRGFTFPTTENSKILLVGGGVGIAPLLYYGKELKQSGCQPTFLFGARTKTDLLQLKLFQELGKVYITTEDGSAGQKGLVTQHDILNTTTFTHIATCGPKPMMKSIANYAKTHNIPCEASLENLMACGLGACLCCFEPTIDGPLRVCTDGPVFNTNRLLWTT